MTDPPILTILSLLALRSRSESMVSSEQLHEKIEPWCRIAPALGLSGRRKALLGDLARALEFRNAEKELAEFGGVRWIMIRRVRLKSF